MILKQIYPPTMMMDLEASSQEAIMELAQAFPYRSAAEAAGLNRFQRVRHACPLRWPSSNGKPGTMTHTIPVAFHDGIVVIG